MTEIACKPPERLLRTTVWEPLLYGDGNALFLSGVGMTIFIPRFSVQLGFCGVAFLLHHAPIHRK